MPQSRRSQCGTSRCQGSEGDNRSLRSTDPWPSATSGAARGRYAAGAGRGHLATRALVGKRGLVVPLAQAIVSRALATAGWPAIPSRLRQAAVETRKSLFSEIGEAGSVQVLDLIIGNRMGFKLGDDLEVLLQLFCLVSLDCYFIVHWFSCN